MYRQHPQLVALLLALLRQLVDVLVQHDFSQPLELVFSYGGPPEVLKNILTSIPSSVAETSIRPTSGPRLSAKDEIVTQGIVLSTMAFLGSAQQSLPDEDVSATAKLLSDSLLGSWSAARSGLQALLEGVESSSGDQELRASLTAVSEFLHSQESEGQILMYIRYLLCSGVRTRSGRCLSLRTIVHCLQKIEPTVLSSALTALNLIVDGSTCATALTTACGGLALLPDCLDDYQVGVGVRKMV